MKTIYKYVGNLLVLLMSLTLILPSEARVANGEAGASNKAVTAGSKVFVFNPKTLRWTVYSKGEVVRSGKAVGGKAYCKDIKRGCRTPVGTFRVYHKEGPNFVSSKYPIPTGGAKMPWALFFRGGYAIHGSNDVPSRHASHGCIRVVPSDARWLNAYLPIGTKVVVKSY